MENENQRRKEILNILENCCRLRHEEEQITEKSRNIDMEMTKKNHQKQHLEEDMEFQIHDADLNSYKKMGQKM